MHEGVPISQPLVENAVFPPMVAQMIKVGEETGELDKMLGKIADFYEEEVDASIETLTEHHRADHDDRRRLDGRRDHHRDVPADVQDALARPLTTTTTYCGPTAARAVVSIVRSTSACESRPACSSVLAT